LLALCLHVIIEPMDVIVTHENADFDAVASQWAAARLFAPAVPYLSRRVNRNVQEFLSRYGKAMPFARFDEHPPRAVERIIVVDSQNVPSVKGADEQTTILFIDHHPFEKALPPNASHESAEAGANTSLLVHRLMEQHVEVSANEATLLLLGIYEDTGALTYKGTRSIDFRASTWLFERGADLDVANYFMHHPLSLDQRALYETLIQGAHPLDLPGCTVMMAIASTENYVEEISTVAHYLRDLFDCDALFVLVKSGDSIQVVARSSNDRFDVGTLAGALGGGGHARAAAAVVRELSLEALEERIRALVSASCMSVPTAGQIMSRSVQTVKVDATAGETAEMMQRYGHEGYPVLTPQGLLAGVISRRDVDRAVQHQLSSTPIAAFMHKGDVSVAPGDSLEQVRAIMVESGLGQVPVTEQGKLVGIVTRTDLIKRWGRTAALPRPSEIETRLQSSLPEDVLILLRAAGTVASKKGYLLYVVGGFVRDLLLGAPNLDIDLVVEGNAISMARAMANRFGGHVHVHTRFGTAKWMLAGSSFTSLESIDFISARREFYAHPTALPEVEQSSIQQDLARRDFTLNTLAICLDDRRFGQLLDFFGGYDDLRSGVIRVLHNLSFIDDPTRILRAVRYEQRLDFRIDARTVELVAGVLDLVQRVSGERIANELFLTFAEHEPEKAVARLSELGVLAAIHPALHNGRLAEVRFARLWSGGERAEPVDYLAALTRDQEPEVALAVGERLSLSKDQKALLEQVSRLREMEQKLTAPELLPSQITHRLDAFDDPALRLESMLNDNATLRDRIALYRERWRDVHPVTTGDRLRALGMRPGPLFRTILETLRAGRLDGTITSVAEEEKIAAVIAQSEAVTHLGD
jgi:tRNA nucleotidyltransferase (CCA-adding enzyme)